MRNYQGTVHDSMKLNYDLASDMDSYILLRICGISRLHRASAITSSSKEICILFIGKSGSLCLALPLILNRVKVLENR